MDLGQVCPVDRRKNICVFRFLAAEPTTRLLTQAMAAWLSGRREGPVGMPGRLVSNCSPPKPASATGDELCLGLKFHSQFHHKPMQDGFRSHAF